MRIRVLGGAGEKGRVSFELLDEGMVLDYGAKRKVGGKWEEVYPLRPESRKLLVSHIHIDHVGGIPLVDWEEIYCSDETSMFLKTQISRWLESCKTWGIPVDEGRFVDFLNSPVSCHVPTWEHGRSGHVAGSIWVKVGDLLYSGDVNPSSPFYEYDPLPKARILILDMAYGDTLPPPREEILKVIGENPGKRIVMPLPSIGRSQEILAFLLQNGVNPVFVDETILEVFEADLPSYIPRDLPAGVYLCTDGMMTRGSSKILYEELKDDPQTLFLITGHAEEGTPARKLLDDGRAMRITWKVHPSPSEVLELVSEVGPEVVIPFHVEYEKAKKILRDIERMGVKVLTPKIGDVIKL